jgi:hypothetical protein
MSKQIDATAAAAVAAVNIVHTIMDKELILKTKA